MRVECVTIFSVQIAKSVEGGIGYQVLADIFIFSNDFDTGMMSACIIL